VDDEKLKQKDSGNGEKMANDCCKGENGRDTLEDDERKTKANILENRGM